MNKKKKNLIQKEITYFWKEKSNLIEWFKKPKKIIEKHNFFKDGQTNAAYNCIRKNILEGNGKKIAIIFINEKNKVTELNFIQLENLVDHFIKHLLKIFSKKELFNNVLGIHSSANIVSTISMLACAKLGITHCVLFNELSEDAIQIRLKLIKCKILITASNKNKKNDKIENIKKKLKIKILRFSDDDIKNNSSFSISSVLNKKDIKIDTNYKKIKSNHPLFILFTSGTTGIPKGTIHSTGGYLVYTKYTSIKQFGINKSTKILTASDAGWMNGHTYALYGPLSIGATTVIIEKPMSLLSEEILKGILFKFKIDILYLPVTLIRLLKAINSKKKIKSPYLKTLGSMGEPLSKHVGKWFSSRYSKRKLQIVNTFYQTETGAIMASPKHNDSIKDVPFGTVGKPASKYLGIFLDKPKQKKSEIKIRNPWPGCMIGIVNGKKIYNQYWDKNRNFKLFDYASYDINKNIIIHGRLDDVINVRGHRIGSEEIESVLLKEKNIVEASAVGIDDNLEGTKIVLFIVPKKNIDLKNAINSILIKQFGSFAIPHDIIYLTEIPKTRSGKILRRTLRDLYINPNTKFLGDLSTMLNKNLLNKIKNLIIKNKSN